mmetsp:Transcript_13773/g.19736  ORF Transcript_13773/g.19736 Transcript_13773/m.19736 type:complete len:226 (+) Transcript_13773:199-876(+)|eukprot:CAMPEP_0172424840 /NCGR_PEP_ID=MMETSP1064-20121228/28449_1 /TAXON_ID=202472 /ORGANISM="Aulacoseira subarctica , Strain CCAP 1002/5" /LENGTH=225 /DNA_ID=CAMNT_0013167249 /DNA_START=125 /DNA_END=802 /DNA_ORIENTATION=+
MSNFTETSNNENQESSSKPRWKHIFSASLEYVSLQYDLMDSITWKIHNLKEEAIAVASLWTNNSLIQRTHNKSPSHVGRGIDDVSKGQKEYPVTQAEAHSRFGDDLARRMSWDDAIDAWKRSLELNRKDTNNHRQEATILNKIGIAYYIKDDLYLSYESFEKALQIQEASLDPGDEDISVTLKNIWIVRVRMKEKMGDSITRELLMLHVMNSLLVKLPTVKYEEE